MTYLNERQVFRSTNKKNNYTPHKTNQCIKISIKIRDSASKTTSKEFMCHHGIGMSCKRNSGDTS